MSKNTKYDSNSTIERCPHDEENPYTMVSNELIRDSSISPNCRWLIIYLLSNKDKGWRINAAQIINHVKKFIGRDCVYNTLDEAIESGYISREIYKVNNMKRYRYFVSEKPKFKKFLRYPEPQYTENQGSKERTSLEEGTSKESIGNATPVDNPVVEDSIVSASPTAAQGSIPFHGKKEIDLTSPEVLEILELESSYITFFRSEIVSRWIIKHGPYRVLNNIKYFLEVIMRQKKEIPKPEAWMETALKKDYAAKNALEIRNKQFAVNLKKKYGLKDLKINSRYCIHTETGNDFYYHLPEEVFKLSLKRMFEKTIGEKK